jgi:hypothetical protein
VAVQLHVVLISALHTGEWSPSCPDRFLPLIPGQVKTRLSLGPFPRARLWSHEKEREPFVLKRVFPRGSASETGALQTLAVAPQL